MPGAGFSSTWTCRKEGWSLGFPASQQASWAVPILCLSRWGYLKPV